MREIDHADDAVDHRVTDSDQAVDSTEGQAINQLLKKVIHQKGATRLVDKRNLSPYWLSLAICELGAVHKWP